MIRRLHVRPPTTFCAEFCFSSTFGRCGSVNRGWSITLTSPEQTYSVGNECRQDRQYMLNVTLRRINLTIFAVESEKYSYSECVSVVLAVQHAMRMRRTVICGFAGSTIFSTLSHKRSDFRTFFWKISHLKKNWERYDQNLILILIYITC